MQWTGTWADFERWWGKGKTGVLSSVGLQRVRHYWAAEHQLLGIQHSLGPVWALIVFSSFFSLMVLPWSLYLPLTSTCTHTHTHTHISTQPQTQGTTLEYQRSLYRLLFPVLYMEDFCYISLKHWICPSREKVYNIWFLKPLFHIIFFPKAVISLWLKVKVRDHYLRRCHHEYYMR